MKKNYLIITLFIFIIVSWGWFLYVDNKPKTSVDIVEKVLINQDFSGLISTNGSITEESFPTYQSYFSGSERRINQFTVLEYDNDNLLIIRTTPGLVDNQIYIQDIIEVERSELESILMD